MLSTSTYVPSGLSTSTEIRYSSTTSTSTKYSGPNPVGMILVHPLRTFLINGGQRLTPGTSQPMTVLITRGRSNTLMARPRPTGLTIIGGSGPYGTRLFPMANDTNSTGIILRTIHREWCERRARWRSQQLVIITTLFGTGSRKPLGEFIIANEVIVR